MNEKKKKKKKEVIEEVKACCRLQYHMQRFCTVSAPPHFHHGLL
jgi:hypothetical protein